MTTQTIQKQLLKLGVKDRAQIAGILLSSLDELTEAENEALWAQESLNRLNDIHDGKAKTRSVDAVLKSIRSKIQ